MPLASVCEVLEVESVGLLRAWRVGEPSQCVSSQEATLTPLVRAVFWKHRRRYGTRRIAEELADLGEVCSPQARVGKLMKNPGFAGSASNPNRSCPR